MDKDKSILEKFTDAVKDIASTATEAASQALKTDEPALRADERAAAYVPLAADGLVSDPLMVPPVAATPERRKRAAKKRSSPPAAKATKARAAKARSKARTTKSGRSTTTAKKAASKKSSNKKSGPVRKAARSAKKRVPTKTRKEGSPRPINGGEFRPGQRSSRIVRISLRSIQAIFTEGRAVWRARFPPSATVRLLRKAITS